MRATTHNTETFSDAASGKYRFGRLITLSHLHKFMQAFLTVLMSPEVATSLPWRQLFSTDYYKSHLVAVAVDEAHCIQEWLGDRIPLFLVATCNWYMQLVHPFLMFYIGERLFVKHFRILEVCVHLLRHLSWLSLLLHHLRLKEK